MHGGDLHGGPVYGRPVGRRQQFRGLLRALRLCQLLTQFPQGVEFGLLPGDPDIAVQVGRRGCDHHQLGQKLPVVAPQLAGQAHRVHRRPCQKQGFHGLVNRPAWAGIVRFPGVPQNPGNAFRADQPGPQHAVLRVQPVVSRHSQSPASCCGASGAAFGALPQSSSHMCLLSQVEAWGTPIPRCQSALLLCRSSAAPMVSTRALSGASLSQARIASCRFPGFIVPGQMPR